MTTKVTFKLKRPYVEEVASNFFHQWRLMITTKEKDIANLPPEDEKLKWITWLSLLQELDTYFKSRILSGAQHEIRLTFSTSQAVVLYRALMYLPLPENELYRIVVREALISMLYPFIISLPAIATGAPAITSRAESTFDDFTYE